MRESRIRLHVRYCFVVEKMLVKDYWKYTMPMLGDYLVWGFGFTMYSVIMGHLDRAKKYGGLLWKMAIISGVVSGVLLIVISPLILNVTTLSAQATIYLNLPVVVVFLIINLDEVVKVPAAIIHYKKYGWLKNITRENDD